MKVRVCPNCGKHNTANTFNCVDCGETLSIKTLMDTESGQLVNIKPIAGRTELGAISPYFEEDVKASLEKYIPMDETVVWGCNISHLGHQAPLLIDAVRNNPFQFGYLIVTNRQFTTVYFGADRSGGKPRRDCLEVWAGRTAGRPTLAVAQPTYELSPSEEASRQVISYPFNEVASVQIDTKGVTDVCLPILAMRLGNGRETSITFYGMHDAEKAQKLINPHPMMLHPN